jgi:uncharacterized membrane protein
MRNIRTLAVASIFMAMITLVTMYGMVPIAQGYLNLGDAIIMLIATVLPAPLVFLIGGLASGLADVLLGYGQYAPFTFIIKGLEGALIAVLFVSMKKPWRYVVPFVIAAIWIAVGYALTDAFIYQSWEIGLTSLGYNLFQGSTSAMIAMGLVRSIYPILSKLWKN